jgi:3-dehydroquinate dehydratase II
MKRVLVLHGPNLDLLGEREPEIYGRESLAGLDARLAGEAGRLGLAVSTFQSNHEGVLIERLHRSREEDDGIILNPGGLAHTSVCLRDAVAALTLPVIEVHLSNTFAREPFRQIDLLAGVCRGVILGLGPLGYLAALRALAIILGTDPDRVNEGSGETGHAGR